MPNLKTLILPGGSNSHYGYSLFVGSDNIENLAILNGEGYNFFEPLNALYSPNIKECLLSYTNKFLNSTLEEGNHIIYKTKQLKQFMYPMDIEAKGYAFSECENFAIFYPNTFDEIMDTFYRCKNIRVVIPESVKILTGGQWEEEVFDFCEM